MGRKSHYVQTVNHKDIDFLNSLRCSGLCTKSQAIKFISANRLKNFILDKAIEKCSFIAKDGSRKEAYRITNDVGKAWIRKHIPELSDRKFYNSTGTEHDLRIMDKILTLTREERQTMRCESEIRDEFKLLLDKLLQEQEYDRYDQLYNAMQNHTISMPDLAYSANEYYEVITDSYGQAEIQAKIDAVAAVDGNLQMERI